MYCPQCGRPIAPHETYCEGCGALLAVPPGTPIAAPPPAAWQPPPATPPSPYVPADLNWIGEAWRLVSADLFGYVGYTFIMMAVTFFAFLLAMAPFIPMIIALEQNNAFGSLTSFAIAMLLILVFLLLQPVIAIGMTSMELRRLRFGDRLSVWDALRDGVSVLLPGLVYMLMLYVLYMLFGCLSTCMTPLITILLYFFLTPIQFGVYRIADGERNAWKALMDGISATQRDWFGYLVLALGTSIIASLGFLLCGIGILFTAPIHYVTYAIAYRANFDTQHSMTSLSGSGPGSL